MNLFLGFVVATLLAWDRQTLVRDHETILEWDLESSSVKNTYQGLQKHCPGVHFGTANNQILAPGDNHQIKFWDMRNRELVSCTNTSQSFPVYPYIRFNEDGTFLAVSATENRIVILANAYGLKLLSSCQEHHFVVGVGDNDSHETLLLGKHPGLHVRKLSTNVKDM